MNKKYELIESDIASLYRIKALKDFGDVKAGDIGGYVESEDNLSQEGNCWIYDKAQVFRGAKVSDNAKVSGNAYVHSGAKVKGHAHIYGDAVVHGGVSINGYAQIFGEAEVYGEVAIYDHAKIYDKAIIHGWVWISGNAQVYGEAEVWEFAKIADNAQIHDFVGIAGHVEVCDNAKVHGSVIVDGNTRLFGDAEVKNRQDYIVFKNFWSSGRYFTWTRSNNMWKVGCFYGTGDELIKKAYKDSRKSGREYERVVKYVETILNDDVNQ